MPEGVSTRMEQLGPHFGKMDPKDIPHLQQYALERDYQDSVASEIEADLQTGALNDSDPEGKSVPNPQRAQQAQADLETLRRTALPPQVVEKIQQRRAIEKADLIGAKTQQSVRRFTLEKHQAQLQDAFSRGVDLSEAALLFHTMEAAPDPAKWAQQPQNARAWQLALDGKAEVHGPDGKAYVVTAQSRDDVQRMAWENAQMKAQMQALYEAARVEKMTQDAAKVKAQAEALPSDTQTKLNKSEAELNRSRRKPPEKEPLDYEAAAKIVDARDPDPKERDQMIRDEIEKARTIMHDTHMDRAVLGGRPGADPLEALTPEQQADVDALYATDPEAAIKLAMKYGGGK